MIEPRDPKGYTCIIDPFTKEMTLTLAQIPVPGDADYKDMCPQLKYLDLTSTVASQELFPGQRGTLEYLARTPKDLVVEEWYKDQVRRHI